MKLQKTSNFQKSNTIMMLAILVSVIFHWKWIFFAWVDKFKKLYRLACVHLVYNCPQKKNQSSPFKKHLSPKKQFSFQHDQIHFPGDFLENIQKQVFVTPSNRKFWEVILRETFCTWICCFKLTLPFSSLDINRYWLKHYDASF